MLLHIILWIVLRLFKVFDEVPDAFKTKLHCIASAQELRADSSSVLYIYSYVGNVSEIRGYNALLYHQRLQAKPKKFHVILVTLYFKKISYYNSVTFFLLLFSQNFKPPTPKSLSIYLVYGQLSGHEIPSRWQIRCQMIQPHLTYFFTKCISVYNSKAVKNFMIIVSK